jgi:GNAT superfamily N-acetyltransferase
VDTGGVGSGWARTLTERSEKQGSAVRDVVLVVEEDTGALIAIVTGAAANDDPSGVIAEIGSLYVLPDRQGQGIGRSLLRAAAGELARLGFSALRVGVLTANVRARRFYEAMGGREVGQRTFDEEGYLLPETILAWPAIDALTVDARKR